MEGLLTLIVLSTVMAAMSFIVGSLPLSFALSSSQLRFVSALGMGVLVGTSLVVIIPEGVETLYSSVAVAHGSSSASANTNTNTNTNTPPAAAARRRAFVDFGRQQEEAPKLLVRRRADDAQEGEFAAAVIPGSGSPHDPAQPADVKDGEVHILDESSPSSGQQQQPEQQQPEQDHDHDHDDNASPHAWIGVALVSGFILMYLIDKLPHYTSLSFPRKSPPRPYHISLDNLSSALPSPSTNNHSHTIDVPFSGGSNGSSTPIATTTGLVIHAAADGIAPFALMTVISTDLNETRYGKLKIL
ncbi:hypothetical protein KEM56_006758 [Ascosphaera pollenicola]|nr:hypothetical protein KEM56_006758 [Ascosphaera pollenicola]